MMTDRELMQQALSALVTAELDGNCEYGATDALRARLAQPEPEHDFYTTADKDRPEVICDRNGEVVLNLCKRCGKGEADLIDEPCGQPEPEPVAWMFEHYTQFFHEWGWRDEVQIEKPFDDPSSFRKIIPLYTAPPKKEWVDLINDEIDDIWAKFNDGYGIIEETLWGYERAIEAKLKEKNGY